MKILCTFSGKFGDILFALKTVKAVSEREQSQVDFVCMPAYASLRKLIDKQAYVQSAHVCNEWVFTGSPYGDQPWQPPKQLEEGYDKVFHLTYRTHPMFEGLTLADAIAKNAGIALAAGPWIEADKIELTQPVIAYGFNATNREEKQTFIERLGKEMPHVAFIDTSKMGWVTAAQTIASAKGFLGCMSSLHILAHAVGKRVLIYEPLEDRRSVNYATYKYPYGHEVLLNLDDIAGYVRTLDSWVNA